MFINTIINYIIGYVNIEVDGYFIEKFINICISKKLNIWNIDRRKSSLIYAKVGRKDYKNIKKISKTTNCKVKINNKKGIPFIINKYRKRKIFGIVLLVVFILILFSSMFIWNIEIIGDTKIDKTDILRALEDSGLKIGKWKKSIDKKEVINKMRLDSNNIAWIGIDIKGTNVIVEVIDTKEKPDIINPDELCDILSEKEGVITKIVVQNGTAQVKVGDIVKNGTLMVSSFIEGRHGDIRYVHSEAEVEAKVWYSKRERIYLNQIIDVRTNKEENKYRLNINNFKINLYKTVTKFKSYDTISEEKKLKIFSTIYLPISITKTTNYELKEESITYTEEQAKQIGIEKLEKELLQEIKEHEKIADKIINYNIEEGFIEVELIYEVLENIGVKERVIL